jgi:hypothetical protein
VIRIVKEGPVVRSGGWLVAAALALVGSLGGCSVGDGLRIEGTASPITPSTGVARTGGPEILSRGMDLQTVRRVLLADQQRVEPEIKDLIRTCRPQCVQLGPSVDLVDSGENQQLATVRTQNLGPFAVFLIGKVNSPEPRVLWTVEGDDMKVWSGTGRRLFVESVVFGPNDRPCCPTGRKVATYQWSGTRIVLRGERFISGPGG